MLASCLPSLIVSPLVPLTCPIMPPLFEGLTRLRHQPDEKRQSGHVLDPPPTRDHGEGQPGEGRRREVCAADRLGDVRAERGALEYAVHSTLGASEERHG